MNFQTYNRHVTVACQKGVHVDPLVLLAYYRTAMRSPAATKFGSNPYKARYRDMRDVLRRRAWLVDMKPRNALEAGVVALNKAQVL